MVVTGDSVQWDYHLNTRMSYCIHAAKLKRSIGYAKDTKNFQTSAVNGFS
jgi:hypothetical protein